MTTFNNNWDLITLNNLQNLIDFETPEGQQLEYKGTQMPRKESICATVAAFANRDGGDFILGIEEENGIPKLISGFPISNIDNEMLKIEQFLQSGIEPNVPTIQLKSLKLDSGNYVIMIRVLRSWLRPHRTIHDKAFPIRRTNGRSPMDMHEIRSMILQTGTFAEQYEKFKNQRLLDCYDFYKNEPFVLVHFLPVSCFNKTNVLDLSLQRRLILEPIKSADSYDRINFRGIYSESLGVGSRLQIFHNGIIEHNTLRLTRENRIGFQTVRDNLIKSLRSALYNYRILGITEPFYMAISFYGVKGIKGVIPDVSGKLAVFQDILDDNILVFPEMLIDPNFEKEINEENLINSSIQLLMHSLANAFGLERSPL